jgi:GT2 family glycosyltransferase
VLRDITSVVYVDSGSVDSSVSLARDLGAEVVELESTRPFTAARARNAGIERLLSLGREVEFVQFIDGDCELQPGWVDRALEYLQSHSRAAVVCGRRRERYPELTAYNRLCDIEWDTPIGVADSCGGDALIRLEAFTAAGGFDGDMIAGEEPDMCFRMRRLGWDIVRLDAEMTLHDAAMTHFSQWWQRSVRSGYATAEAYRRRGQYEQRLRRQVLSNVFWAIPLVWPLWPFLWIRVWRKKGPLYASHIVLGKLPHFQGQARFWWRRWRGQAGKLIEYK